jgi:hypothetical protein
MCKSIVEPDRRITCWIPKARNTDAEYVMRTAFRLQQWLHERAQWYVIRTSFTVLILFVPLNYA